MVLNPETKQTKKIGDLVKSQDWNDAIEELVRLEKDKVNRSGNDKITGSLTIDGALSAKGGNVSGNLSVNGNVGIGTTNPTAKLDIASEARTNIEKHPTAVQGLYVTGKFKADYNGVEFRHSDGKQGIGFGYNTIYATGSDDNQDLGLKAKGTGKVKVNSNAIITGNLDIAGDTARTNIEKHPTVVKSLYVTGKFGADCNGVEFRDFDGRQGIGFGYNTIYATGSDDNQDLGLKAKGKGKVKVKGELSVTSDLSVSGNLTVSGKVNDRNLSADGLKLDNHTHNGTDSQRVKHSDLTLDGGTNPHKTTAADVGALSNKGGTVSGSLSIILPQPQKPQESLEALVLGPTNASNLRLGYHQDYSWIQSHGNKPLLINESGNNIGIGSIINPVAKLDIASEARTNIEKHPKAVQGLYVTGKFGADCNGVEFRDFDGKQGIGFGYNTIYATGSDANQ
ncbi:hypothetical protein, partial [Microcystis aeruginosa]|uniref:hypothetical protein n=1 Tax=Microcystis aeruginosa TaxID=1126 RepID=UPI00132F7E61